VIEADLETLARVSLAADPHGRLSKPTPSRHRF